MEIDASCTLATDARLTWAARARAHTHTLCTRVRRGRGKTFKPQKNIAEGTKQYQLKKYAEATLGSGNLRLAVALPEGEDLNEWLAVNSACMA